MLHAESLRSQIIFKGARGNLWLYLNNWILDGKIARRMPEAEVKEIIILHCYSLKQKHKKHKLTIRSEIICVSTI